MGLSAVVITGYLRLSGRHDAGCPNVETAGRLSAAGPRRRLRRKSGSESICNHPHGDTPRRAARPVAICTAGARVITLSAAATIPSVPSFIVARPHAC